MSLTGYPLLAVLATVTVAVVVATVVGWSTLAGRGIGRTAGRLGVLLLVNVLVMLTAAVRLNDDYLFYATWADLDGSMTGRVTATAVDRGAKPAETSAQQLTGTHALAPATLPKLDAALFSATGTATFQVHGRASGLTGDVVVHLPEGYLTATRSYPVMEAFQGYPGSPTSAWFRAMNLPGVTDGDARAHRLQPVLIVAPQVEFPHGTDTECVNGPAGDPQVETFLTQDVPDWVTHTFRVRTDRASWVAIGLSAGGFCSAMAGLLHPAQYAAVIDLGGYFRPDFGLQYQPFGTTGPLARRYDLVALEEDAPPPVAVYLQTSHVDPLSYPSSTEFLRAVRAPTSVDAVVLKDAGHRYAVFAEQLPGALHWLGASVPGFAP